MLNILFIIIILNISIEKSFLKFLSLKEEKFSKEYSNLVNFIKNNGGYVNPKLIPNEKSNINRYIITKEKINKNEILLYIPQNITISKLNLLVNNKCIQAYGFEEDFDYACLIYFMTIDKYNSLSIFKPYYDYLPKFDKTNFITDFSEKEINAFKETGITEGIKYYYYFYNKALDPVKEKLKTFCQQKNIKFENIIEEFKYNYDLALTRNYGRPCSFYDINTMVPYLDLINHSDKNNTYWFYDDNNEAYSLVAMKNIDKNKEITLSYGKYYNSYLYKNYGFVIPGNIYHEHIEIILCNENFDLSVDSLKDTVKNIFDTIIKRNKKNIDETKQCILKDLNNKKNYYSQINTNRFSMNVIINEHLDIINKYIYEVMNYI